MANLWHNLSPTAKVAIAFIIGSMIDAAKEELTTIHDRPFVKTAIAGLTAVGMVLVPFVRGGVEAPPSPKE